MFDRHTSGQGTVGRVNIIFKIPKSFEKFEKYTRQDLTFQIRQIIPEYMEQTGDSGTQFGYHRKNNSVYY